MTHGHVRVDVYFLPTRRRRLGNRLGPSATTVLKVVEVAKTVAPSGAITHAEAWNAIVGTTTAWNATAKRRMTARVFIVDDVKREQDSIKRNDEFGHLACVSKYLFVSFYAQGLFRKPRHTPPGGLIGDSAQRARKEALSWLLPVPLGKSCTDH